MYSCIVVEPEIHGNLGFLARTMANFEIQQLTLVNPQFQIGEPARNRAVHAQDILDNVRIHNSLEQAVDETDFAIGTTGIEATSSNILRNAVTPEQVAKKAGSIDGRIGIVLGRESKGLTNQELDHCDMVVNIPASDDYPVLNITHAAAVIFYELFKHHKPQKTGHASSRGEKQTLENIFKAMTSSLDCSESQKERIHRCFRNFIGRSFLHKKEAHTLIGFFKQVQHKLGEK